MFDKFSISTKKWHEFIDVSFIPDDMKESYHELIDKRASQIY